MRGTLIQLAVAGVLLVFLWKAFRLAMDLRASRLIREEARKAREQRGQRVVAEVPLPSGELRLFTAGRDDFEWLERRIPKSEVHGCRLLLNGAVVASAARPGFDLPALPPHAIRSAGYDDGRERWDVQVYTRQEAIAVACGTIREGVSREIARSVYEAVAAVLA